ncbi:MAG: hypothetical protein NW226_04175 [Microscillaceae bacterium]|nr:hypothetical protein [Microscillaceae bacterium]
MIIQLGHPQVNPIPEGKVFSAFQDVFLDLFKSEEEAIYLYWHKIPIRIRYREDLYANMQLFLAMIRLIFKENHGATKVDFMTELLFIHWDIYWTSHHIRIEARFTDTEDAYTPYADALNQQTTLEMDRYAFQREWKSLFHQIVMAFQTVQVNITDPKELKKLEVMQKIEQKIPKFGKLYTLDAS